MRLENMREEFPQMPESMRQMVEAEVVKQLMSGSEKVESDSKKILDFNNRQAAKDNQNLAADKNLETSRNREKYQSRENDWNSETNQNSEISQNSETSRNSKTTRNPAIVQISEKERLSKSKSRRTRRLSRRSILAIAAAAAMVGTTVFAGTKLGLRIYQRKEQTYGAQVGIAQDTENGGTVPETVPNVKIETSYLPDGAKAYDEGDIIRVMTDETDPLERKDLVSLYTIVMDLDENAEDAVTTLSKVADSRQLTVGSHDAVLVEQFYNDTDDINRRTLWILWPEYWQVLQMTAEPSVSEDELLKIAEGITLEPTGENLDLTTLRTWSDIVNPEEEVGTDDTKTTLTAEDMKNLHKVGESFLKQNGSMEDAEGNFVENPNLSLCVSSAEVSDNLSILGDWQNSDFVPDSFRQQADENGVLKSSEIRYIKSGDGMSTLDTTIKTETVQQKLLYLTVDYTNNGSEELRNILVFMDLNELAEGSDGTYTLYNRASQESGDWDKTEQNSPAGYLTEMQYFDVYGGEGTNAKNYITSLAPGETVTVHLAFLVNEDELPYLFLNPSGTGGLDDYSLSDGLVDLRQ